MKEIQEKVWYTGKSDNMDYVVWIIEGVVIYISYSSNHEVYSLLSNTVSEFMINHSDESWETVNDDDLWLLQNFKIF